jgi:hypothetical protein
MIRGSGSVKLYCAFRAGFASSDPYPRFQLGHAPDLPVLAWLREAVRSLAPDAPTLVRHRPRWGDYSFDFYMEIKNTCVVLDSHKVQRIGAHRRMYAHPQTEL